MMLSLSLLAALLSTQAPTTQGPAPAAARTVTIAVDNTMKYSVTAIRAKPGERLRIVLQSTATMPKLAMAHNFVLLAAGTDAAAFVKAGANSRDTDFIPAAQKRKVLAMTPLAGPGETVEVTFTAPKRKGTYAFICTYTGHFTLGMTGTLTVR
jgi:azurin